MVRQLAKAPWWAWSVVSLVVIVLVLLAVTGLSLWPRAEAQTPNPDPNSGLVVYFSASNYTVGEGDGQVVITVLLSAASSQTVTVDYATADSTAIGSTNGGEDGGDYAVASGTLTFLPGETSKTIVVEIYDGFCVESNETFTVTLSNPAGGSLGSPSTSNVTIVDDETGE